MKKMTRALPLTCPAAGVWPEQLVSLVLSAVALGSAGCIRPVQQGSTVASASAPLTVAAVESIAGDVKVPQRADGSRPAEEAAAPLPAKVENTLAEAEREKAFENELLHDLAHGLWSADIGASVKSSVEPEMLSTMTDHLLAASRHCRAALERDSRTPWKCSEELGQDLDKGAVVLMESGRLHEGSALCDAALAYGRADARCLQRRRLAMGELQVSCDNCTSSELRRELPALPRLEELRDTAWVEAGRWRLVVREGEESDAATFEATVEVVPGERQHVTMRALKRMQVPVLTLGGSAVGEQVELDPGRYEVRIQRLEQGRAQSVMNVHRIEPRRSPRPLFLWSTVGTGLATVASGIALAAKQSDANQAFAEYDEQRQSGASAAELEAKEDEVVDARAGRDVASKFLYVTSGAFIVATSALVIDWIWGVRDSAKTTDEALGSQGRSRTKLMVGPALRGASLRGFF